MTLSLPNETERRLRPSESARVSSASSQAVMTAASPLLHEMLQSASPSISRLGSPGRYSQSRAGGSPRSGSPGRTRGTLDSPLASVRALSAMWRRVQRPMRPKPLMPMVMVMVVCRSMRLVMLNWAAASQNSPEPADFTVFVLNWPRRSRSRGDAAKGSSSAEVRKFVLSPSGN